MSKPLSATNLFVAELEANHPELFNKLPQMFLDQADFQHPEWGFIGYMKFRIRASELVDPNRLFDISVPGCVDLGDGAFAIDISIRAIVDETTFGLVPMVKGSKGENPGQYWWGVRTSNSPVCVDKELVAKGYFSEEFYALLPEYAKHIQNFEREYRKPFGYHKDNSPGLVFLVPTSDDTCIDFGLETRPRPSKELILGISSSTKIGLRGGFKPLNSAGAVYEIEEAVEMPPVEGVSTSRRSAPVAPTPRTSRARGNFQNLG